jgi:hypothetical protein
MMLEFQMSPAPKSLFWLFAFISIIPLSLGVVFVFDPETIWFSPVMFLLLAAVAWLASRSGKARLTVTGSGLELRGEYGKRIYEKHELLLQNARVIDLNLETEKPLRPAWRKLGTDFQIGTDLPGYRSGQFWLMNKSEAILYVSDWQHVLYIPTTKNHSILFSSPQAATILEKLRAFQ